MGCLPKSIVSNGEPNAAGVMSPWIKDGWGMDGRGWSTGLDADNHAGWGYRLDKASLGIYERFEAGPCECTADQEYHHIPIYGALRLRLFISGT